MSKYYLYYIISLLSSIHLLLPFSAGAQTKWWFEEPHVSAPDNSTECLKCHLADSQGEYDIYGLLPLPRGAEQEALCRTCHNPTGIASEKSNVGNHLVTHGNDNMTIDCSTCHDPHAYQESTDPHTGVTADNLNLVRSTISTDIVPDVLNSLVFQEKPAHFAFGEGNSPYIGVCQTCHTQTAHHTNDNTSDHQHQTGMDCITCHPHDSGFAPSGGGCTDCHSQPQGDRRETGSDFTKRSHHVLGAVQDDDCMVCHYTGNHMSGTVILKDPDQGESLLYSYSPGNPSALEDFCLNCHDTDGATADNGTTPFSDGQIVPNIEQNGLWAASAHSTGGISNLPLTCFGNGSTTGCHGNGHGSNLRKLLSPDNGTAGVDNFNEEEGFCFNCHGAAGVVNEAVSNGWFEGTYQNYAADIEEAFNLHSAHPVNDSETGHTFDVGSGPEELECTSCHGVHSVTGKHWQADSGLTAISLFSSGELWGDEAPEKIENYLPLLTYQAPYLGDPGLDLSGNPLPIDGTGNSLLTDTVMPDYNTMCLECHQYALGSLVAIDYSKKHGSGTAEPADGIVGFELANPFDNSTRGEFFLDCMDCHEPHGSANMMLIKRSANGEIVPEIIIETSDRNWLAICDRCHVSEPSARHHNDDVVYNKLGLQSYDCSVCHSGAHGSIYSNCISSGCHGHNDFF